MTTVPVPFYLTAPPPAAFYGEADLPTPRKGQTASSCHEQPRMEDVSEPVRLPHTSLRTVVLTAKERAGVSYGIFRGSRKFNKFSACLYEAKLENPRPSRINSCC